MDTVSGRRPQLPATLKLSFALLALATVLGTALVVAPVVIATDRPAATMTTP